MARLARCLLTLAAACFAGLSASGQEFAWMRRMGSMADEDPGLAAADGSGEFFLP